MGGVAPRTDFWRHDHCHTFRPQVECGIPSRPYTNIVNTNPVAGDSDSPQRVISLQYELFLRLRGARRFDMTKDELVPSIG
jgi:hypothetical protein